MPEPMDNSRPALVLNRVNAWYGRAQALFECSLELHPKEVVGLLGRNGAGKSTTDWRSFAR